MEITMQEKREGEELRSEGRSTRALILDAAVRLFAEEGYHAATLRDIARLAGIRAASVYHHYPNKQSLLVEIMETSMSRLNTQLEHILQRSSDPMQRLHAAIANHIQLHTSYKSEFFIIDTEIRALTGEAHGYILSLRDHYEELLQTILREGMEQDVFRPCDVKVTSYAIIAMCTQVATWFRSGGRLSVQQVIEIYSQLIIQGLCITSHTPLAQENQ
jgi:AcrR family transcriptional regulator